MSYYHFQAADAEPFGSFEVFYVETWETHSTDFSAGWYWQACFPGCLPDGEPCGPFDSEAEALADAQSTEA